MKTLEQIEPRTNLQSAPAAAVTTTDAAFHFIINQPGSYYLSANLDLTKTNGVQRPETARSSTRAASHDNTGTYGILATAGSVLTNCTLTSNTTTYGIYAQPTASLTLCVVRRNSGSAGIETMEEATLVNCVVSGSTVTYGIRTLQRCTISSCTATSNRTSATAESASIGMGFELGSYSTIRNCTATSNRGDGIRSRAR